MEAKDAGAFQAALEAIKAKVAELKKKLNSSDIGSGANVDKDRGTDNVAILKNINKLTLTIF